MKLDNYYGEVIDNVARPGTELYSPARALGQALAEYMREHQDFYFFSPDETTSNKLDAVYEVSERAWNLPREDFDLPESVDGQIVEMLSENTLFAAMAGHLTAGEPAAMTSYEAFFPIITSQLLQHLKFMQQSSETDWRPRYPSANLLSTSTCWRQDHNGFTHQSPALISQLLIMPSKRSNCFFPIDDVSAVAIMNWMFKSTNQVNLMTFNKIDLPRWQTTSEAEHQLEHYGVRIFEDFSNQNPDYVIAGVGDIVSSEAIKTLGILRRDFPKLKFRFVNVAALSYNAIGTTDRQLSQSDFNEVFTIDKPIIANFHGYPASLMQIFANYTDLSRVEVHGYIERGSTTTPFEMLNLNCASRCHLAIDIAKREGRADLVEKYEKQLTQNADFARKHGVDSIK